MTRDEFMGHAADAAYLGDASLLEGYVTSIFGEIDLLRAEQARLRARIESMEESMSMACEEPPTGCERDELKAKLDAELPAAWREDLASLNECLDRASRDLYEARSEIDHHKRQALMLEARLKESTRQHDADRVETDRLRAALRAIADGFDMVAGSLDDPSAKQLDGYYRGFAAASLEKGDK